MNNNTIFPSFSVILIFLSLSVIGFGLLPLLSIQWLPSGDSASITVWFSWANTSPEVIEQEVITPLEGSFSLVQGVKRIYATARNGSGNIQLEVARGGGYGFFFALKLHQK
ncbi:MAG: efflux RND transporter permease subunit [Saprospiraceae bacterium]|nr:efflux RND transporter permease subunit [Saprospiraceae bacterium]